MPNNSINNVNSSFRKTIPLMVKYSIPVTPSYYALWYAYTVNENPALTEHVNKLISLSKPIDRVVCDELIRQYMIAPVESKLLEMQSNIKSMVSTLDSSTQSAMNDADDLSESLNAGVTALQEDADVIKHPKVNDLVKYVNSFMEKTSSYRDQLSKQTAEIQRLKSKITETERQAYMDGLTGIFNRRKFNEDISTLSLTGSDTCMLIIDIDHFKPFNDEYGHLVGDKVLQTVAQTLKATCEARDGAQAYRFGGEEFAVLLPESDLRIAHDFAEQIRTRVSRLNLTNKKTGVTLRPVTTSLGIAQLQSNESTESLISRADEHLYAAKAAGRNCVRPAI